MVERPSNNGWEFVNALARARQNLETDVPVPEADVVEEPAAVDDVATTEQED